MENAAGPQTRRLVEVLGDLYRVWAGGNQIDQFDFGPADATGARATKALRPAIEKTLMGAYCEL